MSAPGLSGPSQLVLRHLAAIAGPGLLVINPPGDGVLGALRGAGAHDLRATVWRRSVALSTALPAPAELHEAVLSDCRNRAAALLFIPREKALLDLALRDLAACLQPGAPLWVVGDNRAGGKSAGRRVSDHHDDVRKVDVARRSSLYLANARPSREPVTLIDAMTRFGIDVAGTPLTLATLPGVFSADALDHATALLLESLPDLRGKVLDFGCGCGVIGAWVARRQAALDVTLIDDSILAVEASRETLGRNGIAGRVLASDGFSDVTGRFDWIIANPPFHQGAATDYDVSEGLIAAAPEHLEPGGRLVIVANAFLDYGRRMAARFGRCDLLGESSRFRVHASRRSGTRQ